METTHDTANGTKDFVLLDVDHVSIGSRYLGYARLRLFCKTFPEYQPCVLEIDDFKPYFYVTCPSSPSDRQKLEKLLKKEPFYTWVQRRELLEKRRYLGGKPLTVMRLIGRNPWMVPNLREKLIKEGYEVHESDIPFNKRFLIDKRLYCLKKIKVANPRFVGRYPSGLMRFKVRYEDIRPLEEQTDFFPPIVACALDIEVDDRGKTLNRLMEDASGRITAISLTWGVNRADIRTKVFWLKSDDLLEEKNMLRQFLNFFNEINPDVLVTFNGDVFDLPYLLRRMEMLGLDPRRVSRTGVDVPRPSNPHDRYYCPGLMMCDLVPHTWSIHPLSGRKTLSEVAKMLLGVDKIDVADVSLGLLWKRALIDKISLKKFLRYAARDSILTYQLFHALGIRDLISTLQITGYPIAEGIAITSRNNGEFELFRLLHGKNILIPPLPDEKELQRRLWLKHVKPHQGGYVLNPERSLYSCVIIADFRSMYPSIIIAHNIGGESMKVDSEGIDVASSSPMDLFSLEPRSSLAELMESLLSRRDEVKKRLKHLKEELACRLQSKGDATSTWKRELKSLQQEIVDLNRLQYSLKIVANSLYGAHNYPRGRFYQHLLANAITSIARHYIHQLIAWVDELSAEMNTPMKVVYGDTDSIFIWVPELFNPNLPIDLKNVMSTVNDILSRLNSRLPQKMQLEFEDLARRIVFKVGRKKSYAYKSVLNDRIIVKGFEAVRRDWSEPAKNAQKQVLEIILTQGNHGIELARETVLELAKRMYDAPFRKPIDQEWIILGPLKRAPWEYKSPPPAVKAFLHYMTVKGLNPSEEWKNYDMFPYVITLEGGRSLPISDRARHPDLATSIDKEFYVRQIVQAVNRFGLNLRMEEVHDYCRRNTLDEFI